MVDQRESLQAKRPTLLVMPEVIAPSDETMSMAELTAAVKILAARGETTMAWARVLAEAVEDHADQLESLGRDAVGRALLSRLSRSSSRAARS